MTWKLFSSHTDANPLSVIFSFFFILSSPLFFGIYTVVIAALLRPHFICGMQNAYHQPMSLSRTYSYLELRKMRREGIFIGVLFIAIGAAPLILFFI